jgi:hypothetical protein
MSALLATAMEGFFMSKEDINIYELNLSDEHMGHVYRFLGLGKFDRAQHE